MIFKHAYPGPDSGTLMTEEDWVALLDRGETRWEKVTPTYGPLRTKMFLRLTKIVNGHRFILNQRTGWREYQEAEQFADEELMTIDIAEAREMAERILQWIDKDQ